MFCHSYSDNFSSLSVIGLIAVISFRAFLNFSLFTLDWSWRGCFEQEAVEEIREEVQDTPTSRQDWDCCRWAVLDWPTIGCCFQPTWTVRKSRWLHPWGTWIGILPQENEDQEREINVSPLLYFWPVLSICRISLIIQASWRQIYC